MESVIASQLTDQERKVLQAYRQPSARDLRRLIRISVQYALAAGIFLVLAIHDGQPLYAIAIYVIFVLWMIVRVAKARLLVGVMPTIIEKYEAEIRRLASALESPEGKEAGSGEETHAEPQGV